MEENNDIQNSPVPDLSMKQKIDSIFNDLQTEKKKTKKHFKLPRKAKVSKNKKKKGYITLIKIKENRGLDFEKQPIVDGTVTTKEGTYHAVSDLDTFYYKNQRWAILPTKKKNPWNPLDGSNETYGQQYIMAKMRADAQKSGGGISTTTIIVIVAIIAGVYFLSQGNIF